MIRRNSTCENDVRDVAMATVAQLLRVLKVAMTGSQTHHERLGVVEGGGLVVQAVGADGGFNHVELLQLAITTQREISQLPYRTCKKLQSGGSVVTFRLFLFDTDRVCVPVVREHWPEWTGAAGRRSLRTRCPVWSYAATTNTKSVYLNSEGVGY